MAHLRSRIRHAMADLLSGIAAVTPNRTTPVRPAELPCITIWARSEAVAETTNARRQTRTADVFVDAYTQASDGLDDALDALAARVEAAVAAAPKLGGLADKVSLAGTVLDETTIGETRAGVARLHFIVTYQTAFGQPEA